MKILLVFILYKIILFIILKSKYKEESNLSWRENTIYKIEKFFSLIFLFELYVICLSISTTISYIDNVLIKIWNFMNLNVRGYIAEKIYNIIFKRFEKSDNDG